MPDPERLLHTLRRAAQCFRDTPGRRGRFVELQGATEVLAAGDLHGNLDNFRRLLHKAALAAHPGRHLVLQELVHGPYHYPAGGDKSHQLLDLAAALKCQFPRQVHYLLGNHELSQWTSRRICKGEMDLNAEFRKGIASAYGERAAEVYAIYEELFRVVPLALRTPNRVYLSHSLPPEGRLLVWGPESLERDEPSDGDLLPGGAVHSLVWGRDLRGETAAAFLRKVDADLLITGHVPCEQGFDVPNDRQLVLDSLGAPAAYCLFPADRPLTHDELLACVKTL
jgi:hypothetical protein